MKSWCSLVEFFRTWGLVTMNIFLLQQQKSNLARFGAKHARYRPHGSPTSSKFPLEKNQQMKQIFSRLSHLDHVGLSQVSDYIRVPSRCKVSAAVAQFGSHFDIHDPKMNEVVGAASTEANFIRRKIERGPTCHFEIMLLHLSLV